MVEYTVDLKAHTIPVMESLATVIFQIGLMGQLDALRSTPKDLVHVRMVTQQSKTAIT